jgi:ABC-type nitrate/sulfonate/bicarbonate transport system ATPase subunit
MTILEKAHHSFIIAEHDPLLFEDAEMTEYVSKALRQASYEATVLLYSHEVDPFLEELTKLADRVFYFEEGPRESPKLTAKTWQKMKDQRTLEAFRVPSDIQDKLLYLTATDINLQKHKTAYAKRDSF